METRNCVSDWNEVHLFDVPAPCSINMLRLPPIETRLVPLQAVRTVGRTVGHTVTSVATLGCLQKRAEPPRLHLEATFFKVGAEEVKAVARGESSQQVALPPLTVCISPHSSLFPQFAGFGIEALA